jgi:hypothetical protein
MMVHAAAVGGSEHSRSLLRGLVLRMKNKLLAGPLQDCGRQPGVRETAFAMGCEAIVASCAAASVASAARAKISATIARARECSEDDYSERRGIA